ncbi:MAG: preprotein translocase subunit SecG [Bdellovibrio bacteriovorus]
MQTILTILQVLLSLGLIGLVLIQHGRGADAGAAFGSGASATVFGARGSGSFLSRATGILAAMFFLTSMALAYYAAQGGRPAGLMDAVAPPAVEPTRQEAPAVEIPAIAVPPASEVPAAPMVTEPAATSGAEVPVVASPGSEEAATDKGAAVPAPAEVPKPQ